MVEVIQSSSALRLYNCDICYRKFSGAKDRICPDCKSASANEAAKRQSDAKRKEILAVRPLSGYLRVVSVGDGDDLDIGVDVQETSMMIAIKRGYYSNHLVLINASGKVIKSSEVIDENIVETEWEKGIKRTLCITRANMKDT